jgi:hypothetical protein
VALSNEAGSRPSWRGLAAVAAVALAFAALCFTFGDAFRVPFINDDFIFLDRTRDLDFFSLWRTDSLMFGWYRPWSRELHYWWLQLWGSPSPIAFHAVSFTLVLLTLFGYYALAKQAAGPVAAAIALAGAAAMGAWAVPMLWSAGAQELWMLFAVMLCLVSHAAGWKPVAAVAFAIALLSKETAAATIVIAFLYSLTVKRSDLRTALVDILPMGVVLVAWALIHPTVMHRLTTLGTPGEASNPLNPGPTAVLVRSLLMLFNLDAAIGPERGWLGPLASGLPAALALGLLVWLGTQGARGGFPFPMEKVRALGFGLGWAALAWLPLLDPRIGWHSYYGLLGALGAWLALGALMSHVHLRYVALAVVMISAFLRAGAAATPSSDWGSAWYQRRAADFLVFMREDLQQKLPHPPSRSRIYFTGVPSQIGFLTEGAPALRVWYADTSLSGGFLSQYERRGVWEGTDFFFRYDSTAGWRPLSEERALTEAGDDRWLADHSEMAAAFVKAEDWEAAGREYQALAERDPSDPRYAEGLAISYAMNGDSAQAAHWFGVAAGLPGADSSLKRIAREFNQSIKSSR